MDVGGEGCVTERMVSVVGGIDRMLTPGWGQLRTGISLRPFFDLACERKILRIDGDGWKIHVADGASAMATATRNTLQLQERA